MMPQLDGWYPNQAMASEWKGKINEMVQVD
ncbi:hypothetical protein J2S17_003951 [Cytobacillus purgationiresistens]|uniref:Uncharacterized protein n=1 Tax=Cytobacillus purgationiresistens TaxID=863449 RepID=A0ABU0AMF7_9BACI|nr:hypothetical protein [Cytobacillus purgationiresistens]